MNDFEVDLEALREAHDSGSLEEFLTNLSYGEVEPAAKTLTDWHNAGKIDLVAIFASLEWLGSNNRPERRWCRVFGIALESLMIDAKAALELCYRILDTEVGSSNHHVLNGFQRWLDDPRNEAKDVANLILSSDRDSQLFYITLLSWSKKNPDEAIACAIKQTANEYPIIRMQAIRSLSYINEDDEKTTQEKYAILVALVDAQQTEDRLNALEAILVICDKTAEPLPILYSCLEGLADKPIPAIRNKLISGLLYYPNAFGDDLKARILRLMKTVSNKEADTLDKIDMILSKMDVVEDRKLITDVIGGILAQGQSAPKLRVFDSLHYSILSGENINLGNYVVHWLLEGKFSVCNELGNLFPPLDKSIYEFSLDEFGLSDNDIFYLVRKIFVYLMYDHGPAVSLLVACLTSISQSSKKNLEAEIGEFWLRNFPGDIELFQAHADTFQLRGIKASIRRMKGMIRSYNDPLYKLPQNPAMRPSALQRRVQAEIHHQQQKEIRKQADKQSVFSSIFHKSTLLYGRSSIVYVHRGKSEEPIRQKMQLQTYETSTALPRMDCLYPARLNYLLHIFRSEKRPQ